MKTMFNRNTGIAAFAAIVIVGLTGLTLDRAHEGTLRKGVIEIGELETVMVGDLTIASLPAVEVIGQREVQFADVKSDADTQG